MNFEFDNSIPIYLQLVEQLKIDIVSGKFSAGERLPSVRDLALQRKVNPNTVQKAFTELEDMGLVFTERTNGKFVTKDTLLIEKCKQEYAGTITQNYLMTMEKLGVNKNEVVLLINGLGGSR